MIYRNKSSIKNVATAILGGLHPHTAIPWFPGDVTDPDQTAEHVLRHSIVSSGALLGLRVPTAKSHKAHSHRISKNFFLSWCTCMLMVWNWVLQTDHFCVACIATHRDHFVRRPSVCLSVCLSFRLSVRLSHSRSYVSQATHAFLGMLPLFSSYFNG